MKDSLRHDYLDRIIEEAAEWFTRLQDSEVSVEDRSAFAAWLAASPEHVREYLALTALHTDIGSLESHKTIEDWAHLALETGANVIPGPFRHGAQKSDDMGVRPRSKFRGALAASLALAVLGVLWWSWPNPDSAHYATTVGEQKSFLLPDGSLVTLNAVSRLRLRYTKDYRDIQLLSGEALFAVEKNPRRPFRVLTGDSIIRAIGTRFNVYHRRADTVVTVVEGTVEIQKSAATQPSVMSSAPVRVTKGQRAEVPERSVRIAVSSVDAAAETAWRDRRLVFESRPLSEVVTEFNIYNTTRIEIRDASLNDIQVSGAFYANDPQSFALFLQEAKLAHARILNDEILLLPPN